MANIILNMRQVYKSISMGHGALAPWPRDVICIRKALISARFGTIMGSKCRSMFCPHRPIALSPYIATPFFAPSYVHSCLVYRPVAGSLASPCVTLESVRLSHCRLVCLARRLLRVPPAESPFTFQHHFSEGELPG